MIKSNFSISTFNNQELSRRNQMRLCRLIDSNELVFDNQYKEGYVISSTNHTNSNSKHTVRLQREEKKSYSCNLLNPLPRNYSKILLVTKKYIYLWTRKIIANRWSEILYKFVRTNWNWKGQARTWQNRPNR